MQKLKRQNAIINVIGANNLSRQEEFAEHLEKLGFAVNQSSISRDLDELGIVKIGGFYALPTKPRPDVFGLLTIETAGDCLIVAKCRAGLASAVAVRIDAAQIVEIVGTIAGDDTIFIAVKNREFQKTAVKKIWETFEK